MEWHCAIPKVATLRSPWRQFAMGLYVFKSYVRPTMEYTSAVWHCSLKEEDALSIKRIQAGVARCLLKAEWCTPKPTLLEHLNWPALRWRCEIASLTFFHQKIQRQQPPLTDCLFPFAHSVSNCSQRKTLQLLLPHTRSTLFTKSCIALPCYETLSPRAFKKYCHRSSFAKQLKITGPATNTPPTLTSQCLSHLLSDTSLSLC